jgi:hypothetical protein
MAEQAGRAVQEGRQVGQIMKAGRQGRSRSHACQSEQAGREKGQCRADIAVQ